MSDMSEFPRSKKVDAHFSTFSWFGESPGHYTITETAFDIANGVAVVLEAIEVSDIARCNNATPQFSVPDCGTLMRLAVSSLRLLAESAEAQIETANEKARAKC